VKVIFLVYLSDSTIISVSLIIIVGWYYDYKTTQMWMIVTVVPFWVICVRHENFKYYHLRDKI